MMHPIKQNDLEKLFQALDKQRGCAFLIRDLTINSLFYNINTCSDEDFTGKGLDDLKSGKIVTPLPPKEMFLDDPLRVLRAIRFCARFEFEMVEELKVAAADNDVKSAIADKISRERIALFLPLRKTIYGDNKKRIVSSVNYIFRNSLTLKGSDADNVLRLHNAVEKFSSLIPFVVSNEGMQPEVDWKSDMIDVPVSLKLRILLGLLLRDVKDFWRAALMLSILLSKGSSVESVVGNVRMFKKVEKEIVKLSLEKVWEGHNEGFRG
ncbi:hypothetical protein L6452_14485 [Arctium lappa]|uniref:Uncharacterized protein n=1 Tax=Arctium lappa TaxID=4217 RepID=A0ACB9CL60_ARCLA|nr:hypothetical protein L6452_14485 [Arctium lappa]